MGKQGRPTPKPIVNFVIETKRNAPGLSYGQIADRVRANFGEDAKVDKSTVGRFLRKAGFLRFGLPPTEGADAIPVESVGSSWELAELVATFDQHQQYLLGEVHRLKDTVMGYRWQALRPSGGLGAKLHDALREHTHDQKLPDLLDAHESARREREEARDRVALGVRGRWKALEPILRVGAALHDWGEHLLRELERQEWASRDLWPPAYDYSCEPDVNGQRACRPQWNGHSLTVGPIPRKQWPAIRRAHRGLVVFAGQSIPELRERGSQLNQAAVALVDELEDLLLSQRVLGHCRYCPLRAATSET